MVDMRHRSLKARRSLLQRDLMAGIPVSGLLLVFCLSVVFVYVFKMWFMIVPVVILYCVMRWLTARDPWMIEIVLDNIGQKDVYIP